jgi:tRNA (guanine37-N1)-methyltransferase
MGNEDSLVEESHTGSGLLEYPVYTRPPVWRGRSVPDVLLSGDHGRVAAWRHEQALRRTAERRPDLLHPSRAVSAASLTDAEWRPAAPGDAGELLTLQRACWAGAAEAGSAEVLVETLETVQESLARWRTLVLRASGRLVGSVRARLEDEDWLVDRVMVAPDLQRRGLGRWLLQTALEEAPAAATRGRADVPASAAVALRLCRRVGLRPLPGAGDRTMLTLGRRLQ